MTTSLPTKGTVERDLVVIEQDNFEDGAEFDDSELDETYVLGSENVDLLWVHRSVLAALTAIDGELYDLADDELGQVWQQGPQETAALVSVLVVRLHEALESLAEERGVRLGEALEAMGRKVAKLQLRRDA